MLSLGRHFEWARTGEVSDPSGASIDRDHGDGSGTALRPQIEDFLMRAGIDIGDGPIRLLTMPRVLGYVFNPISIWFCWDADDAPIGAIAEVGNTFGELKTYFVPHRDGRFRVRVPKHFYVSPFSELDLDFEFRFEMPGERLAAFRQLRTPKHASCHWRGRSCEVPFRSITES